MAMRSPHLIRAGLVGCGGVAQIIHLPILSRMSSVSLEAICDVDSRKALILGNRFSVPRVFEDIEEMFNSCDLDAVFILTPNNLHMPMALLALKHGVHVFMERPAGRNSTEARKILEASEATDCHVMVGMHTRFRRDLRTIKKVLEKQTLGDIFFIKAEWLQARFQVAKQNWQLNHNIAGGGVLLDLGLQLIDTAWWLTGKPALVSAKAHAQQINEDLSVEDFCSFYLQFAERLRVSCNMSWNFPIADDRFYAEIFGMKGTCTLNPFKIQKIGQGKVVDLTPDWRRNGQLLFKESCEHEIAHFINLISGKTREPESPISDAVKVLEIIDTIYKSLQTNREIHLPND